MKQMICSSRGLGDLTGAKEAEAVLDSFNESFLTFELQLSFSENVCCLNLHGWSRWWKQHAFLCHMDGVYGCTRRWIYLNKSATSLLQNLDGLQFLLFSDFLKTAKLSTMSRSDIWLKKPHLMVWSLALVSKHKQAFDWSLIWIAIF